VRLLRSQLRTRSNLRVIEADVLPLAEIAQDQAREALAQHGTPATGTPASADPTTNIIASVAPMPSGSGTDAGSSSAQEKEKPATTDKPTSDKPASTNGSNGGTTQPPAGGAAPAAPGASNEMQLAARIKDEKDLAAYERIFANTAYWKKLGEEFQQPLIVTGTVLFTPQQKSGIVTQQREVYDQLGRRVPMMQRVYMERKGYVLRPKFVFIDGRTGATIYSESFREERLYPAQTNTPALSSYFEMMDTLIPSFLNTLSTQKVRGTRVLLR